MNYKDKKLNQFNEGGKHHENKHGGIPQGVGSNGKMNTVEEGETSFDLKSGKYIFSDRLIIGEKIHKTIPSKKELLLYGKQYKIN